MHASALYHSLLYDTLKLHTQISTILFFVKPRYADPKLEHKECVIHAKYGLTPCQGVPALKLSRSPLLFFLCNPIQAYVFLAISHFVCLNFVHYPLLSWTSPINIINPPFMRWAKKTSTNKTTLLPQLVRKKLFAFNICNAQYCAPFPNRLSAILINQNSTKKCYRTPLLFWFCLILF